MGRRAYGPVETATRAFVRGLGVLSTRNAVLAATAIRDAQLLDAEEAGSAATALSRELRQTVLSLEPNRANVPAPAPATQQARQDAVQAVQDELEARRQQQRRRPA